MGWEAAYTLDGSPAYCSDITCCELALFDYFQPDTFKVSSPHPVAILQNVAISDSCDLFSKYKLNKKGKKTAPTHLCSLLTF